MTTDALAAAGPLARTDAGTTVVARPPMSGRAVWGADESWRNGGPRYNATIEQVHVHHTANSNDYTEDDVPALLRGIYRYHTHSLGWSDIAYNFLVDRFGRAWIGRAGGAARPVRGAHTLGFNATSSGIAVIGNYDLVAPSIETLTAVVNLAAWKLSMYGRDPEGTAAVISEGSDKYARSQVAVLPVIDGHRDTNDTACPGQLLYDQLPEVRRLVQERIQAAQVPPVTITTPFQLTGDPVVGGALTVTPGAYSPADAAVTYNWLRNGMATGNDPALSVWTVAPEDVGQQIAVVVSLQREGYTGATPDPRTDRGRRDPGRPPGAGMGSARPDQGHRGGHRARGRRSPPRRAPHPGRPAAAAHVAARRRTRRRPLPRLRPRQAPGEGGLPRLGVGALGADTHDGPRQEVRRPRHEQRQAATVAAAPWASAPRTTSRTSPTTCTVSASRTSAGTSSRSGSLRSGTNTSVSPLR